MTFKTHLDEAAFRKEISRWSKPGRTPDYPKHRLFCKEELIGDINGDRFWLKRIQPRFGNTPQKVFYGRIICENDRVIVKGRFRHAPRIRHINLTLFLIALVLYIFFKSYQVINFADFCKGLLIMLLCSALFYEMFNLFSILFYLCNEIFVIKYLKSL